MSSTRRKYGEHTWRLHRRLASVLWRRRIPTLSFGHEFSCNIQLELESQLPETFPSVSSRSSSTLALSHNDVAFSEWHRMSIQCPVLDLFASGWWYCLFFALCCSGRQCRLHVVYLALQNTSENNLKQLETAWTIDEHPNATPNSPEQPTHPKAAQNNLNSLRQPRHPKTIHKDQKAIWTNPNVLTHFTTETTWRSRTTRHRLKNETSYKNLLQPKTTWNHLKPIATFSNWNNFQKHKNKRKPPQTTQSNPE